MSGDIAFYVGILCCLLAAHPFITYPASLVLLRLVLKKRSSLHNGQTCPVKSVSILVCAHNEERSIQQKIDNLEQCLIALHGAGYDAEALVYFDACIDRTVEIAQASRRSVRLVVSTERSGKSVGMHTLMATARGDAIVFTDANVIIDPQRLANLVIPLANPEIGCVCGHLVYPEDSPSFIARVGEKYWRMEESLKIQETQLDSTISADGGLFAIRRENYRPVPPAIIDDLYTSLSVFLSGQRVVQSLDATCYEFSATDIRDEWNRKVRIACRAYNCHRLLWRGERPRISLLRTYFYYSHKVLRWYSGGLLFVGSTAILLGIWIHQPIAGIALALGLLVACVAGWLRVPGFRQLLELIITLLAATQGVVESLRGKRYQVWTPPKTAR